MDLRRADSWIDRGLVLAILVVCLAITYVMLRPSDPIMRLLGRTGSDVVGRIAGVRLAALAMQFAFDGLKGAVGVWGARLRQDRSRRAGLPHRTTELAGFSRPWAGLPGCGARNAAGTRFAASISLK